MAIGVLFVCTGNICRSPTAAGVFRAMARKAGMEHEFHIDSAGTFDGHTVRLFVDGQEVGHGTPAGLGLR